MKVLSFPWQLIKFLAFKALISNKLNSRIYMPSTNPLKDFASEKIS